MYNLIKLIPVFGAIIGAIAGIMIDGNAWRGGAVGAVIGAVGVPAGLWLLWFAMCKIFGFTVA